MITNFKIFEKYTNNWYMFPGNNMFFINDIMKYLKADSDVMDQSIPESPYIDNIMEFFDEVLMNKSIIFQSENKIFKHPTVKGKITEVDYFSYKDEFFVKVKLENPKIQKNKEFIDYDNTNDEWFLIKNNTAILIDGYDADTKPLHKMVKLKKETEKYNI